MARKPRIHYTETDKALMWDRWREGDCIQFSAFQLRTFGVTIGVEILRLSSPVIKHIGFGGTSAHEVIKAPIGIVG